MLLGTLWNRLGFVAPYELRDEPLTVIDLDVDSTLVNLMKPWYAAYNLAWGDTLRPEDVTSWDTHLFCKGGYEVYKFITPDLYDNIQPLPDAVEVTRELARRFRLRALTSCTDKTYEAKVAMLARMFPWVEEVRRKDTRKYELTDIQLLIDDGAHNFEGGSYAGLLLDYPHNCLARLREGVYRVYTPHWRIIDCLLRE